MIIYNLGVYLLVISLNYRIVQLQGSGLSTINYNLINILGLENIAANSRKLCTREKQSIL